MRWLALFLAATSLFASDKPKIDTVAVRPLVRGERANPLDALNVRIEVEPEQKLGAAGLRFAVVYRNIGPDALEILAPDDTTEVSLIDERQTVLAMPSAIDQLLLKTRAERMVTIAPGGEYRLEISVGDVLATSTVEDRAPRKEGAPPPTPRRTPLRLAAGKYQIRVSSSLISSVRAANGSRWLRGYLSDWFSVKIG